MIVDRLQLLALSMIVGIVAAPLATSAKIPSYATSGETVSGTIASVQSVNHIFVRDDRGYTDDVTLASGASVFSNGLRLEPGVRVTLVGSAAGATFLATRIATTSRAYEVAASSAPAVSYPIAVPVYYPAPAYYSAPVYYGASYGYRPYIFGYGPLYPGFRPFYRPYRGYYSGFGGAFFHYRR